MASLRGGVGVMPRCVATKHDGTPCERIVGAAQEYCYSHDPNRADERHRNVGVVYLVVMAVFVAVVFLR
jgi:hypothetical protein